MLVILVIIQIAGILLHIRIDTERARVDILDPEIVGFKFAVNFTLLLAIGTGDPDTLDVRSTDNVIPGRVGPAPAWLRQRTKGKAIFGRKEVGHLIPQLLHLLPDGARLVWDEVVAWYGLDSIDRLRHRIKMLAWNIKDLLNRGGGRDGRTDKECCWCESHLDRACVEMMRDE